MSTKKAKQPDKAQKGPAPSAIELVKVKFAFSKRLAEITLAVPKKTTKADLVEILESIDQEHDLDDFHGVDDFDDSITLLECETIEGDKAKADFVAARVMAEQWEVSE